MGFLNKRPDDAGAAGELTEADDTVADDVAMPPQAAADEAVLAAGAPEAAPVEAEPDAPAGDDASDALLSMFHETDTGRGDRELLLQMAGEVELPDLMDQLRQVSAALHIASSRSR